MTLPEWLQNAFQQEGDVTFALLAARLAMAFILGSVVAGIYHLTRKPSPGSPSLVPTLVLLTLIITMVTLAIGNNVARAFSLVGALAIVRFRTVVEDTRDTAFVIFVVAVGLAVGAGLWKVPIAGIPFAALAAFLFCPPLGGQEERPLDFILKVRVGVGYVPEVLLRGLFDKHLEQSRVTKVGTAKQGASIDLTCAVRLRRADGAMSFITELSSIEGIQETELRAVWEYLSVMEPISSKSVK